MAPVACSAIAWGNVRVETFLDEAADAGYAGVELSEATLEEHFKQPGRLRHELQERHLELASTPFTGMFFERDLRREEHERLRRRLDTNAELEGHGVVQFRTDRHPARRDMVAGEPPLLPLTSDRFAALADALNTLCDVCRQAGLTGALANRVGSFVETQDELLAVAERTEPELVKLAPDLGHWVYAGGDPAKLIREQRSRLAYLQVKDFDAALFEKVCEERLSFRHFLRDGGFKPLGEGTVDLEGALMPLERADFGGWICFALEVVDRPPKEAAQISRDYLRSRLHW
jgi:inosose dehydratase